MLRFAKGFVPPPLNSFGLLSAFGEGLEIGMIGDSSRLTGAGISPKVAVVYLRSSWLGLIRPPAAIVDGACFYLGLD